MYLFPNRFPKNLVEERNIGKKDGSEQWWLRNFVFI